MKKNSSSLDGVLILDPQIHSDSRGHFMGSAFRLGTELVASVVVGTIIGFILDNWFGTKPWFIIIFFFLGVIAVIRGSTTGSIF